MVFMRRLKLCVLSSIWFLLTLFSLSTTCFSQEIVNDTSIQLPDYAVKKINTTLHQLWPDSTLVLHQLNFSADQLKQADISPKEINLRQIRHNKTTVGYLYLASAPSKFKTFDYMVVFNPDLTIRKIRVLIYREHYGGEITRSRWLQQFEGKKNGKKMAYNKHIQAISGATISARSITRDLQKVSKNILILRKKGLLVLSN